MRLALHDLLDFCVNAKYEHTLAWPDDYWPGERRPRTPIGEPATPPAHPISRP
jgi:hypothetical protein